MQYRIPLIVLFALAALSACDGKEENTSVVHDVHYFLDHPDERKSTLEVCHNNPGQLRDDANCKNASAAEREAFIDEAKKALQNND